MLGVECKNVDAHLRKTRKKGGEFGTAALWPHVNVGAALGDRLACKHSHSLSAMM
jgi:hypothetical protein